MLQRRLRRLDMDPEVIVVLPAFRCSNGTDMAAVAGLNWWVLGAKTGA